MAGPRATDATAPPDSAPRGRLEASETVPVEYKSWTMSVTARTNTLTLSQHCIKRSSSARGSVLMVAAQSFGKTTVSSANADQDSQETAVKEVL